MGEGRLRTKRRSPLVWRARVAEAKHSAMNILSIQSHVAYGHAGNASAVFPMQRLGHEVWAVNTVQFSNHTGYGSWKGRVFAADMIREVLAGIVARGLQHLRRAGKDGGERRARDPADRGTGSDRQAQPYFHRAGAGISRRGTRYAGDGPQLAGARIIGGAAAVA